ncbi:MAG: hypothetical protein ACR5LD_07900 [Symbiopectobacterium sp.]
MASLTVDLLQNSALVAQAKAELAEKPERYTGKGIDQPTVFHMRTDDIFIAELAPVTRAVDDPCSSPWWRTLASSK